MEESKWWEWLVTIGLGIFLTFCPIPLYLVKVYPIVCTILFDRLVIVGVNAINQGCWLVAALIWRINRNRTVAIPRDVGCPDTSCVIGRSCKLLVYFFFTHHLGIMISHYNHKRQMRIFKDLDDWFPTFAGRLFGYNIARKNGDVGLFRLYDLLNDCWSLLAISRFRIPVNVCELSYPKLSIMETERVLTPYIKRG